MPKRIRGLVAGMWLGACVLAAQDVDLRWYNPVVQGTASGVQGAEWDQHPSRLIDSAGSIKGDGDNHRVVLHGKGIATPLGAATAHPVVDNYVCYLEALKNLEPKDGIQGYKVIKSPWLFENNQFKCGSR